MVGIGRRLRDAAGGAGNPCSVLTKSPLLLRDLRADARDCAGARSSGACLSIPTLDEKAWRATEPHTPNPRARLEAVAELNRAGIPTGVLIAPLMPGIYEAPHQVEPLLEQGLRARAPRASAASRCICAGRSARCSWAGCESSDRTSCPATNGCIAAAPTRRVRNASAWPVSCAASGRRGRRASRAHAPRATAGSAHWLPSRARQRLDPDARSAAFQQSLF